MVVHHKDFDENGAMCDDGVCDEPIQFNKEKEQQRTTQWKRK